jgi:CHAD domain-containing protein
MSMTTHEEIERKYEVDEHTSVPRLDGIATVELRGEVELHAEYFDTPGGDLASRRIVLRRRSGGDDEGWHIKLPAPHGRTELHWPLTDGHAPDSVLEPIRSLVRDQEVRVVARIHTRRTLLHLLGPDGAELLEFADDVVSASDVNTGILRIWREWETELLGGAPESPEERSALLDAVEQLVLAAGATPASSASKLASALGRTSLSEDRVAPSLDRSSTAGEVLAVAIEALVEELKQLDPKVRVDQADSVHQMRTRIRRLRSLFASYREVFDRAVSGHIRDELKQLGTVLGQARDAEVMRDRSRAIAADHDGIPAEVGDHLADAWGGDYGQAHSRVLAELSGERYFRLLDSLDEFVRRPALANGAFESAGELIPIALARDLKRVVRRARRADAASTGQELIPLLHETRKAAKRLRYAAEAVTEGDAGVFGKRVRRMAFAAEAVHDLLGEHRDSVRMQQHLRATPSTGDYAFQFGVLHEVERHGAALCLAEYPAALAALRRFR